MKLLEAILAPLNHSALEHRRDNAERRLKIITECSPFPVPPAFKWDAIDEDTGAVGHGSTREAALRDLEAQLAGAP